MFKTSLAVRRVADRFGGYGRRSRTAESRHPNSSSAAFVGSPQLSSSSSQSPGKVAPVFRLPNLHAWPGPIERLVRAENPNWNPWAAGAMRMHNVLVRSGHRVPSTRTPLLAGGGPANALLSEPGLCHSTPQEIWIIFWQRNQHVAASISNPRPAKIHQPSCGGEIRRHDENGELVLRHRRASSSTPYSFLAIPHAPHQGPSRVGTLEDRAAATRVERP